MQFAWHNTYIVLADLEDEFKGPKHLHIHHDNGIDNFSTWFEMSQLAADNLCIIVGPLRVSNSAPCSRDEDFHSTFPLIGTSYQMNITIAIVSICIVIMIIMVDI